MNTKDQPLEAGALVPLPADSHAEAPHRHAQRQVSDAELYAVLLKLQNNALYQLIYGGPGPLGRKAG